MENASNLAHILLGLTEQNGNRKGEQETWNLSALPDISCPSCNKVGYLIQLRLVQIHSPLRHVPKGISPEEASRLFSYVKGERDRDPLGDSTDESAIQENRKIIESQSPDWTCLNCKREIPLVLFVSQLQK